MSLSQVCLQPGPGLKATVGGIMLCVCVHSSYLLVSVCCGVKQAVCVSNVQTKWQEVIKGKAKEKQIPGFEVFLISVWEENGSTLTVKYFVLT